MKKYLEWEWKYLKDRGMEFGLPDTQRDAVGVHKHLVGDHWSVVFSDQRSVLIHPLDVFIVSVHRVEQNLKFNLFGGN